MDWLPVPVQGRETTGIQKQKSKAAATTRTTTNQKQQQPQQPQSRMIQEVKVQFDLDSKNVCDKALSGVLGSRNLESWERQKLLDECHAGYRLAYMDTFRRLTNYMAKVGWANQCILNRHFVVGCPPLPASPSSFFSFLAPIIF